MFSVGKMRKKKILTEFEIKSLLNCLFTNLSYPILQPRLTTDLSKFNRSHHYFFPKKLTNPLVYISTE